jgi:hypothetical protein
MLSFVEKGHRVDNKVKGSLTFIAPTRRQMEASRNIPPIIANTTAAPTITETDTNRKG